MSHYQQGKMGYVVANARCIKRCEIVVKNVAFSYIETFVFAYKNFDYEVQTQVKQS